jgi:O-antigen ligase
MIYFYVLFLRIVAYLDGPQKILAFSGVFGLMAFSTIKRLPKKRLYKISKSNFYSILLILFIILHGLIFAKVQIRDIAVLSTYWIWFVFTLSYFKDKTIDESLKFILIGFLIFNLANYIHFKLFFADQKLGFNSIMAMFGVIDYRIFFPLSSGANIFTSQLSFNALLALYFFKISSKKVINILIFIFYLYMLVLADSRQIFLLTIIFSIIYFFSLKKVLSVLKKAWWIIGLCILGFLYIFYNSTIFDGFKRNGELDGGALSRIEIWSIAIKIIFEDFHLLVGHGLNGFENNIPETTKNVFENQNLQTSHNFILQNLIDFGIFGVIIIILFIVNILKLILKLSSQIITILIVMILLIGITESIPSFYSFEPTIFFIAILSIILTRNERKNTGLFKDKHILS